MRRYSDREKKWISRFCRIYTSSAPMNMGEVVFGMPFAGARAGMCVFMYMYVRLASACRIGRILFLFGI
jgi:hypothetical protein